MRKKTTKGDLKRAAGVRTDAALTRWFREVTGERISYQSIGKWGDDDDPIPQARHWQIVALEQSGKLHKKSPG